MKSIPPEIKILFDPVLIKKGVPLPRIDFSEKRTIENNIFSKLKREVDKLDWENYEI